MKKNIKQDEKSDTNFLFCVCVQNSEKEFTCGTLNILANFAIPNHTISVGIGNNNGHNYWVSCKFTIRATSAPGYNGCGI